MNELIALNTPTSYVCIYNSTVEKDGVFLDLSSIFLKANFSVLVVALYGDRCSWRGALIPSLGTRCPPSLTLHQFQKEYHID